MMTYSIGMSIVLFFTYAYFIFLVCAWTMIGYWYFKRKWGGQ